MKIANSIFVMVFAAALTFGFLRAQQHDDRPMAALVPAGALLYLEAKDFASVVRQWDASQEKQKWAGSANFGVLSRSRLIQRLGEARDQFTRVAGVPTAYNLVKQAAGSRSALAFYNLPSLTFVYLTQLQPSRLNQFELWRSRSRYEPREASGVPFFVKSDAASNRIIAVASYKDWLVLATSEEQMAGTLALLSGASTHSLAGETWFSELTSHASNSGDLRLAYNLETLLPTPQFRTYWLQRNVSELKQFKSGIADLNERPDGFEENRVLLRQVDERRASHSALAEILRYAPSAASLYRAWSNPQHERVSEVLNQVILAENPPQQGSSLFAPFVSTNVADVGSTTDFETRIDQPPFRRKQAAALSQLIDAIAAMNPRALLHVQTTVALPDGVFILPQSGAVLECEHPDAGALQRILPSVAGITQTGSLDRLRISSSGSFLTITRIPLTPSASAPQLPQTSTYTAMFNRKQEWPNYKQLFTALDNPASPANGSSDNQIAPTFFSGNLASLGDSLSRFERASITAEEVPGELRESVKYVLNAP